MEIIQKVAKKLSNNYSFSYYNLEDIEQEALIIGMEGFFKWNSEKPFENFIYIHIRNKLRTLRRNKFRRPGCECNKCKQCQLNTRKTNILFALDICEIDQSSDSSLNYSFEDNLDFEEFLELIDQSLPAYLREDYLKLLDGQKITLSKRNKIRDFIKSLTD